MSSTGGALPSPAAVERLEQRPADEEALVVELVLERLHARGAGPPGGLGRPQVE